MKPYIELSGTKIYLPQAIDPHKYEVCTMKSGSKTYFLLCKKLRKRYIQATGVLMELVDTNLDFHKIGDFYVQRTFPLKGLVIKKIDIDWQATSTSTPSAE